MALAFSFFSGARLPVLRPSPKASFSSATQPAEPARETGIPTDVAKSSKSELRGTLFHDHWWLTAATNGSFQEVRVTSGNRIIGRLPFITAKKMGFVVCRMPPFTHVLGPVVEPGQGKPQTQLLRRLSIIRELIDQLPRFDFFNQAVSASDADGLAFQDRGFQVSPQYTFEIDCKGDTETLWNAMHFKARQHIRRAEEKFTVASIDDPHEFIHFYLENLKKMRLSADFDWTNFPELFRQSRARDSGEILCARWPDGRPAAMVYLVWGYGKMYYLLSTRARDSGDNGSINLLIWSAIKKAHSRGLVFDLDGVSTSGTARFLSGFSGSPKLRMIVRQTRFAYGAMQFAKRQLKGAPVRDTSSFT